MKLKIGNYIIETESFAPYFFSLREKVIATKKNTKEKYEKEYTRANGISLTRALEYIFNSNPDNQQISSLKEFHDKREQFFKQISDKLEEQVKIIRNLKK